MGKEGRGNIIKLETAFRERTTPLYCQGLYRLFFDSFYFDLGDERCQPGIVAKGFRYLYRMCRTFEGIDQPRQLEYADRVRQSLSEIGVDVSIGSLLTSLRLQRELTGRKSHLNVLENNGRSPTVGLERIKKQDLWLGAARLVFEYAYKLVWEDRLSNCALFSLTDALLNSRNFTGQEILPIVEGLISEFADRDIIIGAGEITEAAAKEKEDREKFNGRGPHG